MIELRDVYMCTCRQEMPLLSIYPALTGSIYDVTEAMLIAACYSHGRLFTAWRLSGYSLPLAGDYERGLAIIQ